jgi:choline kinase
MRALILAAGLGYRLGEGLPPKALLRFGERSLLHRHVEILEACGVDEVVVGVGYRADLIVDELTLLGSDLPLRVVHNSEYDKGNILTLWKMREDLVRGGDVIVMDADVLYDHRLIQRLLDSHHRNCFLLDRNVGADDEPVKICVRDGRMVELGKQVAAGLEYDYHGESVGFFRLSEAMAGRLRSTVQDFVDRDETGVLYEEALRTILRTEAGSSFGFEDITGLPWTEIDFPADVQRAVDEIIPQLLEPCLE